MIFKIEDVPLHQRQQMWYMHDGAPAHFHLSLMPGCIILGQNAWLVIPCLNFYRVNRCTIDFVGLLSRGYLPRGYLAVIRPWSDSYYYP